MESEADVNPLDISPSNSSNAAGNNGDSNGSNGPKTVKFNPDDLYYDMSGEKHIVIFNHDDYDNTSMAYYGRPQSKRSGSEEDVAALESTFKKLGFTKIDVHRNKSREIIWNILLELRNTDYSAVSCFCIAILTHGYKEGELCAYDKPYYLHDVMNLFENHPTLAGKPKLFFVQACRGEHVDSGNRIAVDGELKAFHVIPSHADFLLLRSTVEDYLCYRDSRGSWLIQELCNAIQKYHEDLDILQIITLVHKKIAYDYATYTPKKKATNEKRQMPETTFTLTKFLKF